MKKRIVVTQKDIKGGIGSNRAGEFCPIERAMSRQLGSPMVVGHTTFGYAHYAADASYPLPERARQFIRDLHDRQPVKPFQFTVEIPDADLQ